MEKASELLKFADKDNLLTLWLKAKLAIYNGNELIKQARIAPGFNDLEKAEKDIYGILGNATKSFNSIEEVSKLYNTLNKNSN